MNKQLVGGDGGDVLLRALPGLNTLASVASEKSFAAGSGSPGSPSSAPTKGKDVIIPVPLGTIVYTENGQLIKDMSHANELYLLARGGEGGSFRTNPQHSGLRGDRMHVILELKSIADIGLVGFPNAGKSSLLAALSRARPRIASYPFTTIRPQIGTIEYDDHLCLRMADIPGLIEGAHANVGMGHAFLRHVERTHALLFVIDPHGFQLSTGAPLRTGPDTLRLLARELSLYQSEMLNTRECIVAVNKVDLPESSRLFDEFVSAVRGSPDLARFHRCPILPVSATSGEGLGELAIQLRQTVLAAREAAGPPAPAPPTITDPEVSRVYRTQSHS